MEGEPMEVDEPPIEVVPRLLKRKRGSLISGNNEDDLEIDWSKMHVVSAIRNQGILDICRSISSVGALETEYMIGHSLEPRITLSIQEVMNVCGSKAGIMEVPLVFILREGVSQEEDCPFTGEFGDMHMKEPGLWSMTMDKFQSRKQFCSELAWKTLRVRPVIAALAITPALLNLQKGQIYYPVYPMHSTRIPREYHAVLLVGHGINEVTNHQFYKIKNSWGVDWCDNGYGLIHESAFAFGMWILHGAKRVNN